MDLRIKLTCTCSIANLKCFPEKFYYQSFLRWCIPKEYKQFPVFLAISSQLHLCRAHQRSLRQCSYITNTHLKIIYKIGPKNFLGRPHKNTTACLKQSTQGICIYARSSWQCKLVMKHNNNCCCVLTILWVCFIFGSRISTLQNAPRYLTG